MAAREPSKDNYTHYVAIDFGTSGTGIALSTISNPENVRVFSHWTKVRIGIDIKAPTVLLLDPDRNFEAFGEEALDLYQNKRNLKYPDRVADYYLFNRFKMSLYSREKISAKLKIKASNGKELPAVEVFAKSLEYLKLITLAKFEGFENPSRKILWIITVPAIWSLAAKQIMKEAAHKASIGCSNKENVIFALEPEAAAIFCEKEILAVRKDKMEEVADYLIVDCGGGTVDIAAHRLSKQDNDNISIEELAPPQGGASGGFAVNNLFEEMLWKLFAITDQRQIDEIKSTYAREWTRLVSKEFEESKYCFDPNETQQEFSININEKLCQAVEKIAKRSMENLAANYSEYKVTWDEDENALVLHFSTMVRLFQPVVSEIIARIEQSLARPECSSIQTILLVGGFANSSFLFEEVKDAFASKGMVVLKSSTPLLSVLKGAVLYSQKRDIIRSRKMGQSIGVKISQRYDKAIHNPSEVEDVEGQLLCRTIFHPFIKVDENVKAGSSVMHRFRPASSQSSTCKVDIYATHSSNIKYTTDRGCYRLGEILIDNPNFATSENYNFVTVIMDFSGTEVKVLAYTQDKQKDLNLSLNFVPEESFIPST